MPNTKAIGSVVSDKIFFMFSQYKSIQNMWPWGGGGGGGGGGGAHFWPQGHNLNKLGGGPLGDATYQIHVYLYKINLILTFMHE